MLSQARWMLIGVVLIVIIMFLDYEYFKYLTIPAYTFGMILLLIVEFFLGCQGTKQRDGLGLIIRLSINRQRL